MEDLPFWISRTYYNYLAFLERRMATRLLEGHLRPGMAPILFVLAERDDLSIKAIGERARLSPSTLTGTLGAMEKAGLVRRRADESDGRSSLIGLTPRARALLPRLYAFHEELLQGMYAGMAADEVASLRALLARLNKAMIDE
jgi:DNA-binding MarR family transcriptional regulator